LLAIALFYMINSDKEQRGIAKNKESLQLNLAL
jgi:hypothetical protein